MIALGDLGKEDQRGSRSGHREDDIWVAPQRITWCLQVGGTELPSFPAEGTSPAKSELTRPVLEGMLSGTMGAEAWVGLGDGWGWGGGRSQITGYDLQLIPSSLMVC